MNVMEKKQLLDRIAALEERIDNPDDTAALIKSVTTLELKKGQVLVLFIKGFAPMKWFEQIRQALTDVCGFDVPVLLFEEDWDMKVLDIEALPQELEDVREDLGDRRRDRSGRISAEQARLRERAVLEQRWRDRDSRSLLENGSL